MAIIIKTPRQVAQEYLDNLKAARPEINTDQTDTDWWIRSRVIGGVVSGVYADLNRVSNDAFPQSARREAIDKHLTVYFGSGLRSATAAVGSLSVTGTMGTVIPANTIFIHETTTNQYASTENIILAGATGEVPVQSINTGQDQNLLTSTALVFQSPIVNITNAAIVLTPGLTDGADDESTQAGANRVLSRIRAPARGGTEADYQNWAIAADNSVVSATVNRHIYGLGTIQLVITAGTNDIDDAIDNDLPIVVVPSAPLKEIVREYVEALNPICDVVYVDAPSEIAIDVTVECTFDSGDKDTIVPDAGATITQGDLVVREVKRALYKTPIGGSVVNGVAAVRVIDIETQIDLNLSSLDGIKYQIVGDRKVTISGGTPNLTIATDEIAVPGTITIGAL